MRRGLKSSRPAWWRFQQIAQRLAGGCWTARRLAAELEMSAKTIERDVEFMRDRLQLPIEATGVGYTFTAPVQLCPCCAGKLQKERKETKK